MHHRDAMTYSLSMSGRFLGMMTADLTPEQLLHRPCEGANCAAWLLGHLILTDRGGYKLFGDVSELPALPDDGFESRFSRNEEAPKAGEFGDVSKLAPLFQETHNHFIAKAATLSEETLVTPVENRPFKTIGEMMFFMPIHITSHAGQISMIRRTLGLPALF